MALPEHFLLLYGYALLFAWVLVEQLGIPLPATPVLLAAGALFGRKRIEHRTGFSGWYDRISARRYLLVFGWPSIWPPSPAFSLQDLD